VTLRDAADYIMKLPKAEQDLREWQAAIEALLLVVELNGPTMMARIGVMRALNRGYVRDFDSLRKDKHWGKGKLKRDEWLGTCVADEESMSDDPDLPKASYALQVLHQARLSRNETAAKMVEHLVYVTANTGLRTPK
jgi:hypothetical protein